jgi:hypothetical protein
MWRMLASVSSTVSLVGGGLEVQAAMVGIFGFPFLSRVHQVGPKRSTRMRSTGMPMVVAASVAASAKGEEPQM